jgi:hypothetical protein
MVLLLVYCKAAIYVGKLYACGQSKDLDIKGVFSAKVTLAT